MLHYWLRVNHFFLYDVESFEGTFLCWKYIFIIKVNSNTVVIGLTKASLLGMIQCCKLAIQKLNQRIKEKGIQHFSNYQRER